MLGQFKPVTYEPYGRRRSGVPRWLVLLLFGISLGAAGVVVIQELYLPARLTVDASSRLRTAFERAEAERKRLEAELGDATKRLETALAENKSAEGEVAAARAIAQRLRDDLTSVIAALPPDPRAGSIEIRAARFSVNKGSLAYDVVLTRERPGTKTIPALMQLLVTGQNARGAEATVSLTPVQLTLGSHEVPRGSLQLPDGFKPRQTTIQMLDRVNGKQLGMRVFVVN
jgi:hypothetical protein